MEGSSSASKPGNQNIDPNTNTDTVRLHITPLTPSTTPSLLPDSLLDASARSTLSYHTLETFPEASYAFVTLPRAQAEKLKKRLNGSLFRGAKVRVEEARPESHLKYPLPEEAMDAETAKKMRKEERKERKRKAEGEHKVKKRKKGEDPVLRGVELPEGRKVQRGWTKPNVPSGAAKYAGKSTSSPSAKKAEEEAKRECLFKTPLPPNKATEKKKDKEKKDKKDKKKRKREVVVKEFENNTKFPSFLKMSQLDKDQAAEKMAAEYVEGKGWVNANGEVVEVEKVKKRPAKIELPVEAPKPTETPKSEAEESENSDDDDEDEDKVMADAIETKVENGGSGSESESSESSAESSAESEATEKAVKKPSLKKSTSITTSKSDNSSSSSSADSDSEESAPKTSPITPVTPVSPPKTHTLRVGTSTSPKAPIPALQITIPNVTNPPVQAIHPLEALYKPTTTTTGLKLNTNTTIAPSPASAVDTGSAFKFGFGADEESDDEPVVHTAFSRDRYRSAAPTPDTAIGHRRFFPDEEDGSAHPGRLGFVPSTPRIIGGFPGGEGLLAVRRDSTGYTPTTESPLLFAHSESRFLGALSVWSKLPTPKILSQTEEEPAAEEAAEAEDEAKRNGKKGSKKRKAKAVEEDDEQTTPAGERSVAEIWSERYYENRGEWNRAWKSRRREVVKANKKKEAAGNGGKRIPA